MCESQLWLLHSNQAAHPSQSHSSDHLLALVGGILKSLSSQWKQRDNGKRALWRGLWQMEQWCMEDCELLGYLGMSLKRCHFHPHNISSLLFSFFSPNIHFALHVTNWKKRKRCKDIFCPILFTFSTLSLNIVNLNSIKFIQKTLNVPEAQFENENDLCFHSVD